MRRIAYLLLCVTSVAPLGGEAQKIDEPALEFSAQSLVGDETISLAQYRGKVVWLTFWAEYCGPCVREAMALERISKLIRSEQFQILGVNIDPKRNLEQARKFIAKHNIGYPSVSDPKQKIFESYGAEIVPTAYLIDREGVVRFVHKGFTPRCEDDIQRKILAVVNELRVASSQ